MSSVPKLKEELSENMEESRHYSLINNHVYIYSSRFHSNREVL
jgi:hypothetical protein